MLIPHFPSPGRGMYIRNLSQGLSCTHLPSLWQPADCNAVESHDDSKERIPIIVLLAAKNHIKQFQRYYVADQDLLVSQFLYGCNNELVFLSSRQLNVLWYLPYFFYHTKAANFPKLEYICSVNRMNHIDSITNDHFTHSLTKRPLFQIIKFLPVKSL